METSGLKLLRATLAVLETLGLIIRLLYMKFVEMKGIKIETRDYYDPEQNYIFK